MLPDLLVSMVVMVVVLGATLTTFEGFNRNSRDTQEQNQAQERTRLATDRLARELRNHWLEKATADDVVGQTVNGSQAPSLNERRRERVRYCLDRTNPDNVRMLRQVQRWTEPPTPVMAETDTCVPGNGWNLTEVVAEHVVNGTGRPAFQFDSDDPNSVREVRSQLFVDADPANAPGESRLAGGVFLRNQNRTPNVPVFEAGLSPGRFIVLNASFSDDPDGDPLSYEWSDNGAPIVSGLRRNGPLAEYGPVGPGTHSITLEVRDPAGLTRQAPAARTIVVPNE